MANNVTIKGIKYGTTTITASYTDGGKTVTTSVKDFKVTAIAPTLTFTAVTPSPTYEAGVSKSLGTVSYNGDGTAYYYIQKATSQPATPSPSASGWTAISDGGKISAEEAGTYYIFLKAVGKAEGNYTGVDPKVGGNNTINKSTVAVTVEPKYVPEGLTYNGTNNTDGSDQTLITAGQWDTGGVMYYYVSTSPSTPSWNNGSGWSTSLPTGKNAGNYYVWYYCLVSDANYTAGTNTNAVKALANSPKNIARKPSASASPVTKLVYNGTTETNGTSQTGIKDSNVSWTGSTTGINAGEYSATATPLSNFAWSDGTFESKSITWSIARRGQTAPVLQGAEATYPNKAEATVQKKGTVAGGTADAPGELIWTNRSRSTAGSQTATAYYAATETNFSASPVSDGVDVKVLARSVTITAPTFNSDTLTYTGSPQTILNAGACGTGGVMYYYVSTSPSTPSWNNGSGWTTTAPTQETNAGTYYVWYYCYVSDTTNNTGSSINTVTAVSGNSKTINQRKLTVTAASKSKEYDGSPLTINSATLSGHVSGHTLYSATYGGSQTTVGSSSSTVSDAVIKSGSTIVTDNYDITYANGTLTVTAATFTVSEPDQEYTYTGSAQGVAIIVSDLKGSQTATIKYRTTSSGDYTLTDAPQITDVSQSPLTVYWQVTAPNHTPQTGSYTITIKKKNATLPGTISGDSVSAGNVSYHNVARATVTQDYTGGTLQYATSKDGTTWGSWASVTWSSGNLTANPSRSDIGTTYVKFRVLGDGNHNNSSESSAVTLTVYKATDANMVVDIVTSTLTYNGTTCTNGTAQTIASVDLANVDKYHGVGSYSIGYKKGSQATAQNQVTWVTSTPLEATDAGTYYVYYMFEPDSNHSNSKPWSSHTDNFVGSVTINPKAGSLTASVTDRTYNGTSGDNGTAQVIGSVSSSTGSYYLGLGSSTTSAPSSWGSANTSLSQINAGTYYVWAKCDASSNGNCAAVAEKYIGTATISPKTSTVTYSVNTPIEEFCILTATPASTWTRTDYHPEIATSSATGTGTGAITYEISQSGWSISSDGKTITIPSTAAANTYSITVTATQAAKGNWAEGSKSQTISVTLKANALERIELSLLAKQIPFGGTTTGTVTAHYTNGANKDVTSSATYSSDPTGIVTITK